MALPRSYSQQEMEGGTGYGPFGSGTNTPNDSFSAMNLGFDNPSFGTLNMIDRLQKQNERDDLDWNTIERDIREEVAQGSPERDANSPSGDLASDVKFFPYPQLPAESSVRNQAPEDPSLVKLFMGNMRFEMSRASIAWAIRKACGAQLDASHVLIHYKSSNGTPSPTGCASVFLPPDCATTLLEYNQRIFCGAKGVYVSLTSESMRNLLRERKVLDIGSDGRLRGPRHAVVIEMSRATPNSSFSTSSTSSMVGPYRPPAGAPPQRQSPPPAAAPSSMTVISAPTYHLYPGAPAAAATQPQATPSPAKPMENPTEFFVGGICYEATPHFVAWMLSLSGVHVEPEHVTLFEDNKTGGKRGCAMVRVESVDFPTIRSYHHRLLCDAKGVYVADNPQGIPAFLRQQKASGEIVRGPSHAVVIEKRRAQATPPPSYGATELPPPPPYGGWTFAVPMIPGVTVPVTVRTPPSVALMPAARPEKSPGNRVPEPSWKSPPSAGPRPSGGPSQ